MDTVTSVLLLISATLFLSYISGLIYTKTKIPDIVWLMALGYLLGPILGFFQPDMLSPGSFNLLILITVAIFSFDTGLNVNPMGVMKTAVKALILSGITFLVIMIVIGYSMHFVLPDKFTLSEGMLLGAMVGGLGGISVTGILDRLSALIPNIKKDGVLINLESTLSDPIRLVAVVIIIGIITQDTMTVESGIKDIVFVIVIATLFGLTAGMLWAEVLSLLWNRPFNYMMTVAALFPIYILSDNYIGAGGGPLTALAFGMAITNYTEVAKKFGFKRKVKIHKAKIREFNLEITFLIKALFFVYLGLKVVLTVETIMLSFGIVGLMLAVRYICASLLSPLIGLSPGEKVVSRLIFMQGITALVLSQLPTLLAPELQAKFTDLTIYENLLYPVVIVTLIIVSIFGPIIALRQLEEAKV